MFKVLLVEDIEECQLVVKRALANAGCELVIASTLKDALEKARSNTDFHLTILDIGLPDGEGMSVLEEMRHSRPLMPIFLLTSFNDLDSKVTAFNLGADDYLVKPISAIELRARVEMRLKKTHAVLTPQTTIRKGGLALDLSVLRAHIESEGEAHPLQLTAKEFKILALLMQNEGRVYARQDLVKSIWGNDVHILERTVDSHIFGLRKKLKAHSACIECIPHVGYRFLSNPAESSAALDLKPSA